MQLDFGSSWLVGLARGTDQVFIHDHLGVEAQACIKVLQHHARGELHLVTQSLLKFCLSVTLNISDIKKLTK